MFNVKTMLQQQLAEVELWHKQPVETSPEEVIHQNLSFEEKCSLQHQTNFQLWHQEDLARDAEASDQQIAQIKRTIDRLNQQRNNLIEELDQLILHYLQTEGVLSHPKIAMNSETPGSIIDRLSISALKIYHMREETLREDAVPLHRQHCQEKLVILEEQRHDLGTCLEILMDDLVQGRKILKVYRQMKMYNDQTLNPVLYKKGQRTSC